MSYLQGADYLSGSEFVRTVEEPERVVLPSGGSPLGADMIPANQPETYNILGWQVRKSTAHLMLIAAVVLLAVWWASRKKRRG